ncbi:hypothetical protein ABTN62_02260, partial [Acinetobacter baumannii]
VPAYGPQNDVTLKMPAFEWVHVQLHQQKGMISLSPPTICNSADLISSQDKTFKTVPGGHMGVVSGSQAPTSVWPEMSNWLATRSD